MYEQPIEPSKGAAPDFSVIWLQSLGADDTHFVALIPELALPASLAGRFLFPHAPYMRVSPSESGQT